MKKGVESNHMKEYKNYYEELIKTPPFAHINSEKDMDWLMGCLEGRIVEYEGDKDLWYDDGFLYVKIGNTGKALRSEENRAEKLCSFKCDFHQNSSNTWRKSRKSKGTVPLISGNTIGKIFKNS